MNESRTDDVIVTIKDRSPYVEAVARFRMPSATVKVLQAADDSGDLIVDQSSLTVDGVTFDAEPGSSAAGVVWRAPKPTGGGQRSAATQRRSPISYIHVRGI